MDISLFAFAPENLVSRDVSAIPSCVSLLISILRLNLVLTYGIPPEFRGGVHFGEFSSTISLNIVRRPTSSEWPVEFYLIGSDLMRDRKRRSKTKNGVFRSGCFDQKKIYQV